MVKYLSKITVSATKNFLTFRKMQSRSDIVRAALCICFNGLDKIWKRQVKAMREEVLLDRKKIGKRLQTRRKEMGLRQEKLAEMTDISRTHISSLERGLDGFSVETLITICDALEITPDYLLLGTSHGYNVARDVYDSLKLIPEEDLRMIQNNVEFLIEKNNKSQIEKKAAGRADSYKNKP